MTGDRHGTNPDLNLEPTPDRPNSHDQNVDSAQSVRDTTLRNMFGRDFIYALGGVLPLAISALILPALTRIMGPSQFGITSLAIAISSVLFILLSFGLQTGIQREYPRPGGAQRCRELITMSTTLIVVLTAALVTSVGAWAGPVGAGRFPWAMELVALWSGGAATALICIGLLRSADRLWAFLVVVLMQSIGAQLVGIVLLLTRGHSAREYLLGLVLGQFLAAILALVFVRPKLSGTASFQHLGRALRFSLPLIPLQISNFILWSGDRIVVQRDLGSTSQARYAVAYAVGAMTLNMTAQLHQAWMPRVFAIDDLTERRGILIQIQKQLTSLLSPTVLGISLAVPLLLLIAAPASYHPRTLVFVTVLIVPVALPYSVVLANTRTLLANGMSARLGLVALFCAAINIGLNVALVPHFGISGSAVATFASYVCFAWASGFLVRAEPDRLPNKLRAQLIEWVTVAVCLATVLIPDQHVGVIARGAGVALCAVFLVFASTRLFRPKRVLAHARS